MSLIIRPRDGFAILHAHLSLDAFDRIVPRTTIVAVLDACHARETRTRKLPAVLVVLICIAMNLAAADALTHVFFRLVQTLRWRLPTPSAARVSKSALSQARYRLGARPLVALFHQVCQPLATAATPDALLFGLRPFALESTVFDLPDTPANAAAFGRPHNGRGVGAWPQAQLLALCECATHAICEAGVWPCAASAARVGRRLVRGVGRGDLLLWDREFHSFAILAATRARHAHLLGRLPAGAHPPVLRTLRDGTQLVRVQPTDRHQRHHGTHLLLRLIRYTLDDPARPGHAIEHRLVTSLLNPCHAPAQILVEAYHARWEFEVAADELKTHQRPDTPLRSQKPVGVIQELYALLIAHYLVRAMMVAAAQTVALPPTRLSFLTALRVIRETLPTLQGIPPTVQRRLYRQLLADLAAARLPPRPNRVQPRVVKQQQSPYAVKRPHHRHWPQPTKPFRAAILLLN